MNILRVMASQLIGEKPEEKFKNKIDYLVKIRKVYMTGCKDSTCVCTALYTLYIIQCNLIVRVRSKYCTTYTEIFTNTTVFILYSIYHISNLPITP